MRKIYEVLVQPSCGNGGAYWTEVNAINAAEKLRKMILYEYDQILKYDSNDGDKKTAIMWLLIALTEVSEDARIALPHLNINE